MTTSTVLARRARGGWAAPLGGGIVVVLVAGLAFEPAIADLPVPGFVARFNPVRLGAALGFGLTGAAVVGTDASNRIGWLMVGIGGSQALSMFLEGYGVVALHEPGAGLVAGDWAIAFASALWAGPYLAVPALLLLLVPDGRLPHPRWWPVAALAAGAGVVGGAGWFLLPPADFDVALHPAGHEPGPPTWSSAPALATAGGVLAVVALVGAVAAVVVRYRRASRLVRGQLAWIVVGGALTPVLGLTGFALGADGAWVAAAATVPLPLAIAVAVGRFGLWDRDGLLARVLVGTVLVGGVLAGYLLVVSTLGAVLGETTGASLVATAAVAIAVVPAHRWAVRWANRLVHGDPENPAVVLRRLGARLESLAGSDVTAEACREIAAATRASGVEVVVDDERVASWGTGGPHVVRIALHRGGVPLGELRVAHAGNLGPASLDLLRELAPHVGVVAAAAQLDRELVRSRARLLAARDDERGRLERELHDGVGPTLAALALELDRGRLLVRSDAESAMAVLDQLADRLRETAAAVRGLVTDLRPPPLDELGLPGALEAEARRFAASDVRFEVRAPDLPALPADVELSCFRIAAEAMTNVVRHAQATTCRVQVEVREGALVLVVADDGVGFADSPPRGGTGLRSMRERAELIGGELVVASAAGGGTTVRAVLPLGERASG